MTYFNYVALGFGIYCILAVILHILFGRKFPNFILDVIMPEKKPGWMIFISLGMGIWVVFTWYLFMQQPVFDAFIVSLFLTLGLIKAIVGVLHYDKMRLMVKALLTTEKLAFNILLGCVFAMGIGLIVLGL